MTLTRILQAFGIGSGKSNPVEASSESNSVDFEPLGHLFIATQQLRVPSRILALDGKVFTEPQIPGGEPLEMWQGVFLPHYKFSDPPEDKRSPYLDFLIAVSEILELSESIDGRIEKLHTFWSTGQWKKEKESEGGVEAVINRFFPRFVETIPGVSVALAEEMCSLGISTANKVLSATDEELINIKGVGKTRLKKIREYCATSTKKDSDRIDLVIR